MKRGLWCFMRVVHNWRSGRLEEFIKLRIGYGGHHGDLEERSNFRSSLFGKAIMIFWLAGFMYNSLIWWRAGVAVRSRLEILKHRRYQSLHKSRDLRAKSHYESVGFDRHATPWSFRILRVSLGWRSFSKLTKTIDSLLRMPGRLTTNQERLGWYRTRDEVKITKAKRYRNIAESDARSRVRKKLVPIVSDLRMNSPRTLEIFTLWQEFGQMGRPYESLTSESVSYSPMERGWLPR